MKFDLRTLEDINLLGESLELECKLAQLKSRFGHQFEELDFTGRLVMATAAIERVVSHKRLLEICEAHSHDLSLLLSRLVRQGLLVSDGKSRGVVYFLPGESLPTPDLVFMGPTFPSMDAGIARTTSEHSQPTSEHSQPTSEHSQPTSEHSQPTSEHLAHDSEDVLGFWERDAQGRMLSAHLDAPIVDDLNKLEPTFLSALKELAQEPAHWSRLERSRMESVILSICQDQFLTLSAMSQLVCRSPDGLRQQYLSRMVKSGSMTLAFPTKPTHEKQAYRAVPGVRPIEANESARRSQ